MKNATREKIAAGLANTSLAFPTTDLPACELEIAKRHWVRAAMDQAVMEKCLEDIRKGRVYSLQDLADMLHCSHNTMWRIFRRQPGVIRIKSVYRIPETIFRRVMQDIMTLEAADERNAQ